MEMRGSSHTPIPVKDSHQYKDDSGGRWLPHWQQIALLNDGSRVNQFQRMECCCLPLLCCVAMERRGADDDLCLPPAQKTIFPFHPHGPWHVKSSPKKL